MRKLFGFAAIFCLGLSVQSLQGSDFLEPIEFKSPYEDMHAGTGLELMDQVNVDFSEDGVAYLKYLEEQIKDAKASRLSSRGLGASLAGVGIGLAPITLGLSLLYTGIAPVFIVHGESLKKDLNGWRLIKASYIHCGYKNPSQEKLVKHDERIKIFISKYLKLEANAETVDRVAKAIVVANEKGWFGIVFNDSRIFRQNNHRQDICKKLFIDSELNPSLMNDSSVAEKILKYAEARNEYQEKQQEIMENL
ncbi:MAG: hypothetical protein AB8G05_14440 [Oligoflexales bacterium]